MQQILKQAYNCNYEDDALVLSKAANIVREDIQNSNCFQFSGSFPPHCQQDSVPTNLKYLVSMLLNGSSNTDQDSVESQNALTISQAILFNLELYQLDLSVSYDRILELERHICEQASENGLVCPRQLRETGSIYCRCLR